MALGATVYKATLAIADIDRGRYADHALTIACHPSETVERMMLRLLAFVLYADERLAFGRGVSTDEEPDLWQRDLSGAIVRWIEVGLPDLRRVRRACNQARAVVIVAFGGARAAAWWRQNEGALQRIRNLTVLEVPQQASTALAAMAQRTMQLSCSVQHGELWIGTDTGGLRIDVHRLHEAPSR